MRKRAMLAVLMATAAAAPVAAATSFRSGPATAGQQERAMTVARLYWLRAAPPSLSRNGYPLCGRPRVSWQSFGDDGTEGAFAAADGTCQIVFDPGVFYWPAGRASGDTWQSFCTLMAHEWGHLVLGVDYFASTNPSDPAHSPDPRSVMYPVVQHYLPACTPARAARTSNARGRSPGRSSAGSAGSPTTRRPGRSSRR